MEMRFVILKEKQVILQKFTGALTYDKWLKSAEAIWKHPDYVNSYRGIVDFRGADVQMGISEIRTIVELLTQEQGKALRADAVILIDEPGAAAFASIYSASVSPLLDTKIVTTEEGAAYKFGMCASVFQHLNGPDAVILVLD
ncbi:MAG: hypothetical protein WBG42_16460 [Cryomorphaceae bacterium]